MLRWLSVHDRYFTFAASVALAALTVFAVPAGAQTAGQFETAREQMVKQFVAGAGVTDPRVLEAIRSTPRHEFVDAKYRKQAYYDMALPIGENQTISSPFIVAFMTQSLDPQPTDKVLEIGTGSGYQAAVLSPLVKEVYTIEIVESLGRKAERTLQHLKYHNISVKVGDGFLGWPEHAPFDKIIVTCSPEKPPQALIDQLREGGLMVIPVGQRYQQTLYLMRKKDGKLEKEALQPTLFVPMTGKAEDARRTKPDPAHPAVVNGNFEESPGEDGSISGWYYHRQVEWKLHPQSPERKHIATFNNEDFGRASHILQGMAIDGRQVHEVELSAWVTYRDVVLPLVSDSFPAIALTFYDEQRRDLGHHWIGPFRGTSEWKSVDKRIKVPPTAREAILRVGLFGATGQLSVDDVQLIPVGK